MANNNSSRIKEIGNSNIDVNQRIVITLAAASSIANTIGFLANFFLYGMNFPTAFCAFCAVFCWINFLVGVKSSKYMAWGTAMMVILCVLEFPLLVLTYGAVMYPYLILGYMGVLMLSDGRKRIVLCVLLVLYDVTVIIASLLYPYMFGPQDTAGLMGSAVITFLVTIISFSVCIIIWQMVYVRQTSDIDPITGVLTAEGFDRSMKRVLKNADPGKYAILYFNVINFRGCNTVYGIDGGNHVLAQLAERFKLSTRLKPYFVCRESADHFYALVDADKVDAETIQDVCRFKYISKNMNLALQLNCGIYYIQNTDMNVSDMCDRARAAISYSSQVRNLHYAQYDNDMEEKFSKESEILAMVEEAITSKAFVPFFQPIIDCKTGKIVSAEALARWIRSDGTIVSPGVFIPVLEQKELITELDYIITRKLNEFMEYRRKNNKRVVPISVNLSRVDLYNESFMNQLQSMMRNSKMHNCGCHFEVTESVYEAIPANISEILSRFRKMGAKILIDDFGSGYSSLGMITECEFDMIKLDISFARKIEENEKMRGVVKSLIELAHNLGADVVAEGVETEAQYDFLKSIDCDYVQGYYFYKPMNQTEFEKLLEDDSKFC